MATATEVRYTPEDLLAIDDRPTPELVDGQLVEREPMGQEASEVIFNIGVALKSYARTAVPGVVAGSEGGFQVFPDDPGKVRFPDVSFTRRDRLPGGKAFAGHCEVAPELMVEVVSPNDLAAKLLTKIREYQDAGVPWIWVVNPDDRTVLPFRRGAAEPFLGPGDVIRGGDVLTGFECPVAEFFEGL